MSGNGIQNPCTRAALQSDHFDKMLQYGEPIGSVMRFKGETVPQELKDRNLFGKCPRQLERPSATSVIGFPADALTSKQKAL
jgi:hypothetical protein